MITGVVTDPSGAPVPGARVVATNADTNEIRSSETSESGVYTVGPMRIGTYNVSVEKSGFRAAVWKGLEFHAQDRVRADVALEIGQVSESVSVTSEAPLLQAETSSLSQVVDQREIRGLPLKFNLDFGLMKNFRLTERFNLQFRWETFNLTNTPTLANPNTNIERPGFGKVRGTVSVPRQMQFALRLSF